MKYEQDLVGGLLPLERRVPSTEARREVRLATDKLIFEAAAADLPGLSADLMLTLARQLNRHAFEPQIDHFIEAAHGLIDAARSIYDAGMRVDDDDKAMVGAVMIEIVIRGMFHTLGWPYEAILQKRFIEGKNNGRDATTAADRGAGEDSGDEPDPPLRAA